MKWKKYRWLITGVAFLISAVNYVDRSAIAFAMPILSGRQRRHVSETTVRAAGLAAAVTPQTI
jgi:hypothetical protein